MAVIIDPDSLNQGTEVTIDTGARTIQLTVAGNLSNDGVTLQALYSFLKEEWKTDAALIKFPFPMTAITPEQFEFIQDWAPADSTTRKLIRTGGWREIQTDDAVSAEYMGVVSLGTFEDAVNDLAYYAVGNDPADTGAAIDFAFAGPVNEAIITYEENAGPDASGFDFTTNTITRNDAGDWAADGYQVGAQVTVLGATTSANNGTFVLTDVSASVLTVSGSPFTSDTTDTTARFARNYRNAVTVFLRVRDADPEGKTYAQSALSDIGVTVTTNQVYRFPLSNSTDLKVTETDANISSNSPYTEIEARYFDQAFSLDVDTPGTPRDFGIVVDVGTHSGVDGSASSGGSTLTTAEGGVAASTYDSGTLTIHEGSNAGTYAITTASGTSVSISGTFPAADSDMSFTLQRSSPVIATAEEIYEKVQYLLRQAADIDSTDQTVNGRTADELLQFVGDTLKTGTGIPSNPNGGGSGVYISGFDTNDTNRLVFTDNTGTERTFPFVSAGTINFNANLVNDSSGEYWMFFAYTTRATVSDAVLSASSGSTASLDSAGGNLPTLAQGDFIQLNGFTDSNNNGIWEVTDASPTSTQADVTKYTGETVSDEGPVSVTLDQDPIDSPDAIIVDNNSGADIVGPIGSASVGWDFDYDGNTQGGRTPASDAPVFVRAIGLESAQFAEASHTITRATGQSISLVAAQERNYANP